METLLGPLSAHSHAGIDDFRECSLMSLERAGLVGSPPILGELGDVSHYSPSKNIPLNDLRSGPPFSAVLPRFYDIEDQPDFHPISPFAVPISPQNSLNHKESCCSDSGYKVYYENELTGASRAFLPMPVSLVPSWHQVKDQDSQKMIAPFLHDLEHSGFWTGDNTGTLFESPLCLSPVASEFSIPASTTPEKKHKLQDTEVKHKLVKTIEQEPEVSVVDDSDNDYIASDLEYVT
jgi:hypothetical protein